MMPEHVVLTEVGLRDGLQFEPRPLPTAKKLEAINLLIRAGVREIQVASFVNPKLVPQMADAEALCAGLPRKETVVFSGLVLNKKGLERALAGGLQEVEVSISASETHSRQNTGLSLQEAGQQARQMIASARRQNVRVKASIQCAFGCVSQGRIPEDLVLHMARDLIDSGAQTLSLADTTGMANPLAIKSLLESVHGQLPFVPVSLHLHDTRGLGLVNLYCGLEQGVSSFDTAFGGMGGCPFLPGAAGNIATEDTLNLLHGLHLSTGIRIDEIVNITTLMENFFQKRYPAKIRGTVS
ncbi:MAG: hydroxymethylglutaryl-CoA lyase [Desulfohalobiaceae bacterium]|nr:hydroxymethylglutaryl-CoA lyase [Desulfohalobiaceae bacterium]